MNITQTTLPWGNSTGIRLPKKVLRAAKWQDRQEVAIKVHGDQIILEPVQNHTYKRMTLDEMLEGVTPELVGGEFDWGDDVGSERWYD